MGAPVLDFWFDFASTYSYPAACGSPRWPAGRRPRAFSSFLLGPIFKTQGWTTSPFNLFPAKGRHMWRDLERLCAGVLAVPAAGAVSAQRARGARALAALDHGWGEDFCRAVFRAIRGGRRIDDVATISDILAELKVEPAPVLDPPPGRMRSRRGCGRRPGSARAARPVRGAELHHRRRRIVLGQRPARAGAALGEALTDWVLKARSRAIFDALRPGAANRLTTCCARRDPPAALPRDKLVGRVANATENGRSSGDLTHPTGYSPFALHGSSRIGRRHAPCSPWPRAPSARRSEDRGREHGGGVAVANALDGAGPCPPRPRRSPAPPRHPRWRG